MDNLRGITAKDWLRLARENRFAIDRKYMDRAWALTILSLRNSWFKRREDQRFHRQVAEATIHPPIFILGHWRSGTTLVHDLLTLDEQFAYPNLFQVANPHTCLTLEQEVAAALANDSAQSRPMDNMQVTFRSPGEDEAALSMLSLRSPIIAWSFPRREAFYDRFHSFRQAQPAELSAWREATLWFYKKLSLRYAKPLVLKSPIHTARVKILLDLFPQARFIHIRRDPYTVFRSTQQLYAKAVPFSYLQEPDHRAIDDGILRRYNMIYGAYFEDCPLIPARQLYELRFEDLERDMVGQMGQAYEALGLQGFDRLRPKIEQYAQSKTSYQKNRHLTLSEPLRTKIAQTWGPSFERWGYAL